MATGKEVRTIREGIVRRGRISTVQGYTDYAHITELRTSFTDDDGNSGYQYLIGGEGSTL